MNNAIFVMTCEHVIMI